MQYFHTIINLLDYGARWYSSSLGRFVQPDSIVPDLTDTQAWNRYAYVDNNPIRFNDPTGHLLRDSGICLDDLQGCDLYDKTDEWEIDRMVKASVPRGPDGLGLTAVSMAPGAETVDDLLTFTTGCGITCQAGFDEPVGLGWRIVAGFALIAPFGGKSLRLAADGVGGTIRRNADDVLKLKPQMHHLISNPIQNALDRHPILSGVFDRDTFIITQAADVPSHIGWQSWHRKIDFDIPRWLSDHPQATAGEFLDEMLKTYKQGNLPNQFPNAVQELTDYIKDYSP